MRITRATSEHADAVARIHVTSRQLADRGVVPDTWLDALSLEEHRRHFQRRLTQPRNEFFVLEKDGAVRGWIAIQRPWLFGRTTELSGLYVAPDAFRSGVGSALWNHVRGLVRARGQRGVVLWVMERAEIARRFYESRGFAVEPGKVREVSRGALVRDLLYSQRL